jgi:lipopolysaccharide export system protein LptA
MKNAIVFAVAFVIGLAVTSTLHAAAPVKAAAAQKQDCAISVTSDKFTADLNARTGTYSGNVMVTQCDTKLRADTVRISTLNNQADKVTANGNVVVDSPKSGTATGQNGIYDVPKKTVVMTGNVVLKKNKDVMRGAQLTINLATGQASLGGGVKGTSSGRVQAVFTPNSSTTPGQ